MAGGTFNIVTGIPFSVTFNNGTNTFTITGGDYTDMFNANALLTALGGSPNGGYQQVISSVFSSGNTTVTVTPYAVGTSYPGPSTYTTGTGTIIWFMSGAGGPSFGTVWSRLNGFPSDFGAFPSQPQYVTGYGFTYASR
jgi:hypothetical protein